MKLYLVRHGESLASAQGRERTEESLLSEKGIEQVEFVADRFENVLINHLYVSPSVRAKQTGDILAQRTHVPAEQWADLLAIDEKAESFDELNARAARVLDRLVREHKSETIVCVSHAMMVRMITMRAIFGEDLTEKISEDIRERFGVTNTGVTMCEWTEAHGWMLMTFNGSSHLI